MRYRYTRGWRLFKVLSGSAELGMITLYDRQPEYYEALEHYKRLGFKIFGLIPNNAGHFPDLNEVDCLMCNPVFIVQCPM
jgi:hypothetical protein